MRQMLIDTDILSRFLRGDTRVVAAVSRYFKLFFILMRT